MGEELGENALFNYLASFFARAERGTGQVSKLDSGETVLDGRRLLEGRCSELLGVSRVRHRLCDWGSNAPSNPEGGGYT